MTNSKGEKQMIKLETSCKDCIHSDVCRNKGKAENSANKLEKSKIEKRIAQLNSALT